MLNGWEGGWMAGIQSGGILFKKKKTSATCPYLQQRPPFSCPLLCLCLDLGLEFSGLLQAQGTWIGNIIEVNSEQKC